MVRPVDELTQVDRPAWPGLREAIDASSSDVRVLPVERATGERVIERLQVTAASALGALALETGGILVDCGWLRILGGGADGLASLASANDLEAPTGDTQPPPALVVAWDVIGGRFAIDGGGLGVAAGQVCYFAPDLLRWEGLDLGHGDFVHAMVTGATSTFYDGLRWPGWEDDCEALALDHGFAQYPPPFSAEGQDPAQVSRRPVPITELFAFHDDAARQLGS